MADDPTVQISLQRARECPTCGNNVQPEEKECSLCGTLLPPVVAPPPSSSPALDATVVVSPPLLAEAPDATVVVPAARKPAPAQEETGKVTRPESTPPPLSSQSKPSPAPVVKPASAVPPRRVELSSPPPPPQVAESLLLRWGGLAVGTVALFLLSFFTAKMFLPTRAGKVEETPLVAVDSKPDKETKKSKEKEGMGAVAAPSQNPQSPPPDAQSSQLVGRVTTADQLLTIRIFGAEPSDSHRGVAAIRTQVEKNLKGIRDLYTAHLETNPQSFGVVILEFNVAPGGQVTSPVLHTTGSAGRELEQTIVSLMKEWQFPETPGEEVKVFYPLLFSPEKIDPAVLVSHIKDVWPGRYKILAATPVSVHTEAKENAQEVGAISPGMFLSVVSSRDGWIGALSPKGKVGYIRQEAIFPRIDYPGAGDARG